jgi:HEAT repeat protein
MRTLMIVAITLLLLPVTLPAQSLVQRIRASGDGTVRLSFAARPGVCGHAGGISIIDDDEDSDWVSDCNSGPVRVSLRMRGGKVSEATTRVAGRWRSESAAATDLGMVSARDAADALLTLARAAGEDAGDELITAATLADSAVVWPELLGMARDHEVPLDTRKQAVFWLGQAAGDAATRGLDSILIDDRGELEVREQAVFALSQRPADEGVPALIRIARVNPNPELRKKALFWLGQSEDPRALTLFEEILK